MSVTLDDLVGERVLDGVDIGNVKMPSWIGADDMEDCDSISFRLNGVVYIAVENPDDGYRSSMRDLLVPTDQVIKNTFAPVRVLCRKKERGEYERDILQLIDLVTGKPVLEVGTENTNDYYPWFVGTWHPENMSANQGDA